MDDADGVRGAQGAEDGEADARGLGGRQRPAAQRLAQGLALHQLHHDPGDARLGDDVVHRDGGRMPYPGRGAGLPVQPVGEPPALLVRDRIAGQ
ncbi:hypothetical protein GA0115256_10882 [Streptomyces sp. DconLS]|nr:hypothetical protein GA0115256_10882 [Streptomyces sp. DconLS]